jgi:hypothetical protein
MRYSLNFRNRVYISGRVSGRDMKMVEHEFSRRQWELEGDGIKTYNPVEHCKPHWGWKRCMTVGLFHLIFRCNTISLPADYNKFLSKGMKIEYKVAIFLRYKIMIQYI